MPKQLFFQDAEKAKKNIMVKQQKEIAQLYEDWADDIGQRAKYYSHKTTSSAPLSERYYKELKKQLQKTSDEVTREIYGKVKSNIYTVADAVVADNVKWLESFGFSPDGLNAAFSYVPHEIVQNLVTGQIYDSGWSLSSRIWGDNQQTLKDIYTVMAKGVAENKPIYYIAKELESYVRPSARLPWNLRMADGKKIYKKQVDYNAQRLARTLVQHGYQQSFLAVTQKNPFVTEYIWISNGSRVCELCKARDGKHYKKDELPLDHPNGMCTMSPVVVDDMVDQLANWFNSPDGTYPDIDAFASNFGYKPSKIDSVDKYINKYGKSSKTPKSWYNTLSPIQKAEAKALKDASGKTWDKWYLDNIYDGDGSNLGGKSKAVKSKSVKNAIPDYNKWINVIKKQNEKDMLEREKEWMKLIGEDGKNGIITYSGSAYSDMNKYLRLLQRGYSETDAIQKSNIPSKALKAVKDAINGLNNVKLDDNYVLRRGTDLGDIAGAFMSGDFYDNKNKLQSMSVEELDNMFSGAVGKLGSFTSTSSLYDRGFPGDVEIIFYAPKGTNASSIMSISQFGTTEGETLLNAGTTVKCTKIEKSDGHKGSNIRAFIEIVV